MIVILFTMLSLTRPLYAETFHAESGPRRTSLVELYSSEGCSSCPPADAWFSGFKTEAGLWSEFIPIAFHVNYWDGLGWKDPLAKPEFTARQHALAGSWRTDTVYTPGIVLDGTEWKNWRRGGRPKWSPEEPGLLEVSSREARSFEARYQPGKALSGGQLHGALLGFGIKSNVRAGENGGKLLSHDFVVLDWKHAALKEAGGNYTAALELGTDKKTERTAAVFWVTGPDGLTPLQAAGGYLN